MAGVTGYCKECGFIIFDEQTRQKLCDACASLPPEERRSALKERQRLASEELTRLSPSLTEENSSLKEQVKQLRDKLHEYESKENNRTTKETQTEASASFLRKFENLDTEGEF